MLVKDIMTADVVTIRPEETIREIASKLIDNHIKGAPVVTAEGKLVGIITEADLILQNAQLHLPTFLNILDGVIAIGEEETEEELRRIYGVKAKDIMSTVPITVHPDMVLNELATMMWEQKINPVPVLDDGKLVGIVSRADIVQLLVRED